MSRLTKVITKMIRHNEKVTNANLKGPGNCCSGAASASMLVSAGFSDALESGADVLSALSAALKGVFSRTWSSGEAMTGEVTLVTIFK